MIPLLNIFGAIHILKIGDNPKMSEVTIYSVGEQRPQWRTRESCPRMSYAPISGLTLHYFLSTPNDAERRAFEGDLSVAFNILDNIPFFLFNFDETGWIDAPLYPHYYPLNAFDQVYPSGKGMILTALLIDADSGKLESIRALGLSTILSNAICVECRRLLDTFPTMFQAEVDRRISAIYDKYPTSESMLKGIPPQWTTSFICQ